MNWRIDPDRAYDEYVDNEVEKKLDRERKASTIAEGYGGTGVITEIDKIPYQECKRCNSINLVEGKCLDCKLDNSSEEQGK